MTVEEYIENMSLEEKAALLQGKSCWTTWDNPRLGIPSMFLSDGPHGLRKQEKNTDNMGLHDSLPATCFPTAAAMACSWDPELGQSLGYALGQEAAACDVHVVLGPGLNVKRSPLCGRNFEYFSEDPYLSGKMAAGYIRGIQAAGVAACPKHFAANSQELMRMTTDSVVDMRTLRELYLTGFEIAVTEGKPMAIMTAYNRVNGTYANENPWLLQDVLRKEWGFEGFVVSDWGGSNDHAAGVRAGSALEMPTPGPDSALSLIKAVRDGELPESALDDRLRELLPVILSTHKTVARAAKLVDKRGHHLLAQKCAEESAVLLENDGILPLKPGASVAVIGEFAKEPRYQGSGSSKVHPTVLVSLPDALKECGVTVQGYALGYSRSHTGQDPELLRQAELLAAGAEAVILCLGLDEISETEGLDRSHMELPEAHLELLRRVRQVNSRVILVLSGGAPFRMPSREQYRAAVHGYLSGQAGAAAMAHILTGKVNPSGRLAETWPVSLEDTPTYGNFPGVGGKALYREGLYIGYRYYDTADVLVQYPFGYGLSYTQFTYGDLQADADGVSFTLTNTGDRDGAEVTQVYVSCPRGKVYRPNKELKGFQKVFLRAGESRRIHIALDDKAFRYFNTVTQQFEREAGDYEILVGSNVFDIRLKTVVSVEGTEGVVPELFLPSYHCGQVTQVSDKEFAMLLGHPIPEGEQTGEITALSTVSQLSGAKSPVARWISAWVHRKLLRSQAEGDPAPDTLFIYNLPIRGFGQMTGGKITRQMAQDVAFIANGHLIRGLYRLIRDYFRGRREAKAFLKTLTEKSGAVR